MCTKSVIVPIYKKGSANLADNYRGISLGVFSKIFTNILNSRLPSNNNKIVTEEQAGFRKIIQRLIIGLF